ncbi:MAG TPA: restriction endonuclease [Candidatus Paceibacterota bacterium]
MSRNQIYITKASGAKELFDSEKLENSLLNSGASPESAEHIVDHIAKELEDGMSSSMLYDHAYFLLDRMEKPASARYSLKRALGELGPTGFPFEKFMAEVFRARSYHVETDQNIKGHCAEHEVDLVAWNENRLIMCEAKFHNELGLKSDLKVALYVKARFDDLRGIDYFYGKKRKLDEGWLITNTKFTDKAIKYALCSGLRLIGWNFPAKGNLHDIIEDVAMHPVTSLNTLSQNDKKTLIDAGIVLCRDVRNEALLKNLGFNREKIESIIEESKVVCPIQVMRNDNFSSLNDKLTAILK